MKSVKTYDNSISWDIKEIEKLKWKFIKTYCINPAFKTYVNKRYKNVIGNDAYFLPNDMPKFVNKILQLSFLKKYKIKSPGFHRFRPGMILPLHIDSYNAFSKMYDINDKEKINRYIFFLENSKLGHMIQVNDKIYNKWNAGDFLKWNGSTPHAAFNLGIENRYTLQITCYE